jgi:hemolysin activation/secretion protein
MLFLLAQLVSPPLQPGPARIPAPAAVDQEPKQDTDPLRLSPESVPSPLQPHGLPRPEQSQPPWPPPVEGATPYTPEELGAILSGCDDINLKRSLQMCAEALTARLQQDGYVNSRVYVEQDPPPGRLVVVVGRLVEIRVDAETAGLGKRVHQALRSLLGEPLQLPILQARLRQLRQRQIVGSVSGSLGKLGSDPTQAVLQLSVTAPRHPWRGDISLRNDGNAGSGEWRALAVLQKRELLLEGDVLQLYGEGNTDSDPEFGAGIGSLSYTLPLGAKVSLTGSFGASRRNFVEASGITHGLSFRQYQGLGQLQWTLSESDSQSWYGFTGLSANHNNSYLNGASFPLIIGGGLDGDLTTGYLRFGIGSDGQSGSWAWSGQLYGLQGIAGFSSQQELQNLGFFGIDPGESRALGGIISNSWTLSPTLRWSLRAAGQVAFNELTNDMGFSLGSDTGLRGLPGTLISGDSGWLGSTELAWTFWQQQQNTLQLVPFIGMGGISTQRDAITFSDTVGSGGLLLRWLNGRYWSVELGWIDQFHDTDNSGFWSNWLLSRGLYGKVQYRF